MASRLVTYEEWLKHGHYPDGSKPGAKFTPGDDKLEGYYNNYVSTWNAASEALRVAINVQHGLGSFNSGGSGDGDGDGGGGGGKFPSTGPVFSPLDPAGIAQRDYSKFYPQAYTPEDPAYPTMGLLSQPYHGGTDLYQPWSAKYGANVAPSNLWNYNPPSLPGPGVEYFNVMPPPIYLGGSEGDGTTPTTPTTPTIPGTPPPGGDGPDRPGADSDTAASGDPVIVNGVEVPRGYTIYNGELMTFADAERAKAAAAVAAAEAAAAAADALHGGIGSSDPGSSVSGPAGPDSHGNLPR